VYLKKNRGFTLVELALSVTLVAVGFLALFSFIDSRMVAADAPELKTWSTAQVSGPVRELSTYTYRGKGYVDWAYFKATGYMVLNGQSGASALCPSLTLRGIQYAQVALGALQGQQARPKEAVPMSVLIPKPSQKVNAEGCAGVVTKPDHFEYQGLTIAYVRSIDVKPVGQ
jgi:prepilin-type N-terminal cleavage/methylation domain-containing protein